MSNRWGIPKSLEDKVRERDKYCVYCRVKLASNNKGGSRKNLPTWEHIINDAGIITPENIALCCASCNSSKGTKLLSDWINSDYCKRKGINSKKVAPVVKKALKRDKY